MVVRILLALSLCVALAAVCDSLTLNRAVDALAGYPWGREPGEIRFLSGWREAPYGEMDDGMEPGYAFASRVKEINSTLRLRLFTYAEPSLVRVREAALMGALEGRENSEARARALQDRILALLQAKGFAVTSSDRVAFTRSRRFRRERVVPFARGELAGQVYYYADSQTREWIVRAAIQHSLARRYGSEYAAWWPRWWQYDRFTLPDRLVRELESSGAAGMFPPGDWARIRDIPRTGGREVSLPDLERFYSAADPEKAAPEHRPAVLLLKNYLTRYVFAYGPGKLPKDKWFSEEDLLRFRVDLVPQERARRVLYGETFLFRLARDYPDTYWGQYAFLETFRMGLTPPTRERGDHWMKDLRRAGRDFLTRYPRSGFAPDILFLLGRLAETEYSMTANHLKRAWYHGNRWRDEPLPRYAEESRLTALDLYRRVLDSPRRAEFEEYLEYTLPRLRAGVGTGCDYSWWR
jgi:hypothetical protein